METWHVITVNVKEKEIVEKMDTFGLRAAGANRNKER